MVGCMYMHVDLKGKKTTVFKLFFSEKTMDWKDI